MSDVLLGSDIHPYRQNLIPVLICLNQPLSCLVIYLSEADIDLAECSLLQQRSECTDLVVELYPKLMNDGGSEIFA